MRYFALRDPQGEPTVVIALTRDITREREAERELQESQARFREFADTVDDSLFVTNPQRTHFQFMTTVKYDGKRLSRVNFDIDPAALNVYVVPEDMALLDGRRERELRLEPTDIVYRVKHPRMGMRWIRSPTLTRLMPVGEIRVYGSWALT